MIWRHWEFQLGWHGQGHWDGWMDQGGDWLIDQWIHSHSDPACLLPPPCDLIQKPYSNLGRERWFKNYHFQVGKINYPALLTLDMPLGDKFFLKKEVERRKTLSSLIPQFPPQGEGSPGLLETFPLPVRMLPDQLVKSQMRPPSGEGNRPASLESVCKSHSLTRVWFHSHHDDGVQWVRPPDLIPIIVSGVGGRKVVCGGGKGDFYLIRSLPPGTAYTGRRFLWEINK